MKNFWFSLDDKIRFNFLFSYFVYSLLCYITGEAYYQYILAATWAVTSVISFSTQKLLVFKGGQNWLKEYFKCCATWFFSYLINAFLLEFFVKSVKLNVYVSQFIATFAAAVFTYIIFKVFAFKSKSC